MPGTVPLPGATRSTFSQQSVPSPDWLLGTYDALIYSSPYPFTSTGRYCCNLYDSPLRDGHLSFVNCLKGQVVVHRFHADLRI